jgi:hypothetical protein
MELWAARQKKSFKPMESLKDCPMPSAIMHSHDAVVAISIVN